MAFDWILRLGGLAQLSHLVPYVPYGMSPILFDATVGAAVGVMHMLCELPNSRAKRRRGIGAGGSAEAKSARSALRGAVFPVMLV